MKCVRIETGVIRISDTHAEKLVAHGAADYVPRHVWKKETRGPIKKETADQAK